MYRTMGSVDYFRMFISVCRECVEVRCSRLRERMSRLTKQAASIRPTLRGPTQANGLASEDASIEIKKYIK